jgi:tRNA threonylcarbamoyl adenosine modification protein (Sua5/YciO/YrdC/YwlC family)
VTTNKFQFNQLTKQQLRLLKNGGVGILPTDTVYGVVTVVSNSKSVKRLYQLKNRESKPGTIIAASTQQLIDMGIEQRYVDMASQYWPNPISVVIPVDETLAYIHQGLNSLAFRVVSDPELGLLLSATGPLLTSSANSPGQPVAITIQEAQDYFGDAVDFYIDGGNLANNLASTVIKVAENGVTVLRMGSANL